MDGGEYVNPNEISLLTSIGALLGSEASIACRDSLILGLIRGEHKAMLNRMAKFFSISMLDESWLVGGAA